MEKYKFTVDGISVTIYPVSVLEYERKTVLSELVDNEYATVLLPDQYSDFRIECFDKNNSTPREPYICLTALSCFFERVRKYPPMSLDIDCNSKKHEIKIGRDNAYHFSLNSSKCKLQRIITVKFDDGVEVVVNIFGLDKLLAAVLCDDASFFDRTRILLLFEQLKSYGISSVSALSHRGVLNIRTAGDITFYDAVNLALATLNSYKFGITEDLQPATVNGVVHKFKYSKREVVFYPEVKYIS